VKGIFPYGSIFMSQYGSIIDRYVWTRQPPLAVTIGGCRFAPW
jgi:hypothetical protein